MVDPTDNGLAGVTPSTRVPVVVMPGNLSPGTVVTELVAAATEVTVEPAAVTATPDETAEMTPEMRVEEPDPVTDAKACRVKDPLAVFEAILQ